MNFLAHLYLADDEPESLVGNLMGDFLKGVNLGSLSEGVRRGVTRHLRVDAFTDAHPVVLRSKRRLRPPFRRYAGVLVDVYYDHFLACHWERYSPEPLLAFTGRVYETLLDHEALMPDPMRSVVQKMAAEDWLGSYVEIEAIGNVLRRMSRRLTRENPLAEGTNPLLAAYPDLEADFHEFFPDLAAALAWNDSPASTPRAYGATETTPNAPINPYNSSVPL